MQPAPIRTSANGRQSGDYIPTVLAPARGGSVPTRSSTQKETS